MPPHSPAQKLSDAEWRKRHPHRHRLQMLKNIEIDALSFEQLILKGCAVCGMAFVKSPHCDHDHRICNKKNHVCKKCFRGFLCGVCNSSFIAGIERQPALRTLVHSSVLAYIDKLR
jgi:hypothetical protein